MDGIVQQIKYAVDFIAKKFPDSRYVAVESKFIVSNQ